MTPTLCFLLQDKEKSQICRKKLQIANETLMHSYTESPPFYGIGFL